MRITVHSLIILAAIILPDTRTAIARLNPPAVSAEASPGNRSVKPNVLLIYTDDQGTLDMNIYGARDLYTPNMDALARSGVRFTQFYAAAPVCSPSRAALMTGRYPQRAGLSTNAPSVKGRPGMPGEQVTLAEMFKAAGYTTGHIGKWHMGFSPETMPNAQGFDYSFGHMGGCIDNYSHFFYWQGPNRHDLFRNGEEIWEDGRYFPELLVEETGRFLKEHQEEPFFLYLAVNIPHYPLQGEEKWRQYYSKLPEPRRQYAAFISTMDEKIGQVIRKLKESGLYENTIVILQSDHGHSEEERTFSGGGYAGQYRGAKFSLFEGGIRVPSIISWPGKIPAGEVRAQFAANVDWMPTLSDLCSVALPGRKIDGKSLVQVIRSETAESPHKLFFWQTGKEEAPQWCVRKGDWKLLGNPFDPNPDWDPEKTGEDFKGKDGLFLVHLPSDIGEKKNRAGDHPEKVRELLELYTDWINNVKKQ